MERSQMGEQTGEGVLSPPSWSWSVAFWLALNLPLLFLVVFGEATSGLIESIAVSAALIVVPGAAWTSRRGSDLATYVIELVVKSFGAGIVCVVLAALAPGPTHRLSYLGLLLLLVNAGLVRLWRRKELGTWPAATRFGVGLVLCMVAFYGLAYVAAEYTVPALEDQDMETQGTAYGLVNELKPTMVTNRGNTYFFAHPLLLHFLIGESALLSADLERLRYYHESAVPNEGLDYEELVPVWQEDLERFTRDPVLLATRTPNLMLAAVTLVPLSLLVIGISGSRWAALLAALVYMTLPEVFVRSGYGGYMALTNFVTVSAAYAFLHSTGRLPFAQPIGGRSMASPAGVGVLAFIGAWTNQKILLLPAAAGLQLLGHLLREARERLGGALRSLVSEPLKQKPALALHQFKSWVESSRKRSTAFLLLIGFGAGWAAYVAYGSVVAIRAFYYDHVRAHLMDRFRFQSVNLIKEEQGGWVYPSIVSLWGEFSNHAGWAIAIIGFAGVAWGLSKLEKAEGFLALWFVLGAIGFSLTDWRQTKHLALLIPPLVVLLAVLIARQQKWARVVTDRDRLGDDRLELLADRSPGAGFRDHQTEAHLVIVHGSRTRR